MPIPPPRTGGHGWASLLQPRVTLHRWGGLLPRLQGRAPLVHRTPVQAAGDKTSSRSTRDSRPSRPGTSRRTHPGRCRCSHRDPGAPVIRSNGHAGQQVERAFVASQPRSELFFRERRSSATGAAAVVQSCSWAVVEELLERRPSVLGLRRGGLLVRPLRQCCGRWSSRAASSRGSVTSWPDFAPQDMGST